MLALTKEDVDFENNQISITKTYYRTERRDIITTPKTEQSVRVIDIPQFLTKEIEMYVNRCYGLPDNERLFPIVAEAVQHKLKRACVKSGVKQIRVHDLRHPYVKHKLKNLSDYWPDRLSAKDKPARPVFLLSFQVLFMLSQSLNP